MLGPTPEQIANAMRYGVCPICRTPRELHRGVETHPDGHTTHWQALVYPCGHGDPNPFTETAQTDAEPKA